ncbi:MAG: YceI family protein [Spirosomataceae bacterium]
MSKLNLIRKSSSLTYSMKNRVHAWTGICGDFSVKFEYNKKSKAFSSAEVIADVASFDSGIPQRDRDALKILETKRFPTVSFISESTTIDGENLSVNGTLIFHGVSQKVAFKTTQKVVGKQLKVKGDFSVKLTDYNLKPPGSFLLKTDDNIDLKFNLVFDLATS